MPTRLVGGPLVFRVTDPLRSLPYDDTQILHYALVFRLNRPDMRFRVEGDPYNPDPVPDGAGTPVGDVTLLTSRFLYDSAFGDFQDPDHPERDADNCFVAELRRSPEPVSGGDDTVLIQTLDRLRLRTRIRVIIRPLSPTGKQGGRLGRRYVRHPGIRPLHVTRTPMSADTVHIADPAARRALLHIGCAATDFF